jgi:hypothetical protein
VKFIVVTRSKREEIQEDKIKGAISIPTHPLSPKKEKLYFDPLLISILAFLVQILL